MEQQAIAGAAAITRNNKEHTHTHTNTYTHFLWTRFTTLRGFFFSILFFSYFCLPAPLVLFECLPQRGLEFSLAVSVSLFLLFELISPFQKTHKRCHPLRPHTPISRKEVTRALCPPPPQTNTHPQPSVGARFVSGACLSLSVLRVSLRGGWQPPILIRSPPLFLSCVAKGENIILQF